MRSRRQIPPKQRVFQGCVALLVVDSSAVRKKVSRDYEKAKQEIQRVRDQLQRFEQRDKPLFRQWLHAGFGTLLTSCRETEAQIQVRQAFLYQVEDAIIFDGISPGKAYEQVMREQTAQKESARNPQEPREETPPEEERRPPGDDDETFDFFEEFEKQARQSRSNRKGQSPSHGGVQRLKELYRLVVRRLHPDLVQEMTPQKTEWWHQAQAAYEQQDVDQLEIILSLCEIEEQRTTRNTSVSILQRVTAALKRSLKPLRAEMKRCQGQPSWGFSTKQEPELVALARKIRAMLEDDLASLKGELEEIEDTLKNYKSRKKRGRRLPVDPFEFMFGRF